MKVKFLALLLSACLISACTRGLIYTDVTYPLVTNMSDTKRGTKSCSGSSHLISEPVTRIRMGGEWEDRSIGGVSQKCKLKNIYFADRHVLSILGGSYKSEKTRVWGD